MSLPVPRSSSDLVRHKRPAQVVHHAAPERIPAVIYGKTQTDVLAELKRLSRGRTLAQTGTLRLITMGTRAGQYALPVEIIARPAPSRWRKRAKVTALVLGPAGVLFGLGWWSVATLGAAPFAALLVAILATLVMLVRSTGDRRPSVTVTTKTTVSVR